MNHAFKLLLLSLAIICCQAKADSDQEIANYLAVLKSGDYQAATLQLAYPSFKNEAALAERQQRVLSLITTYHEILGQLLEAPAKGSAPGQRISLGISGGTEDFVMEHPATDFRQIPARFSTAGIVYLTFMLAEYQGSMRIMYMQYDYVAP